MGIDLPLYAQWDLSIMIIVGPEFIDSFIQRCMVASALSRTSTTGTRRSGRDKEVALFLGAWEQG